MFSVVLSFIERQRHDAGVRSPSSEVDLEVFTMTGKGDWHIRHADRLLQRGRHRAAGHFADRAAVDIHIVPMPRDSRIDQLESYELAREHARLLHTERIG